MPLLGGFATNLNGFPDVFPCTRGSSNLDELHGRLEHALMIRRLKKDVSCWCGEMGSVPLMRLPCLSNAAQGLCIRPTASLPRRSAQVLDELPDKIRKRIPVEVHGAGR